MFSEKLHIGQLLISDPSNIGDHSFNRAVILLAEHNHEGSVGFILNKPLDYTINDLIPEIDASFVIYNGGPVEQDNLYFIHTLANLIPNSIEILNGIYWGGDFDLLKILINQGKISKEEIRFFLGYSGWSANQLAGEIQSKSWIVIENNYKSSILYKSTYKFWKEEIMELGGDYMIWSNAPENPILN